MIHVNLGVLCESGPLVLQKFGDVSLFYGLIPFLKFIKCKYMKHIFELQMKDQIEERSLQLLFLLFDLSSAVQIYVSYIYIYLFILHGYITNSRLA